MHGDRKGEEFLDEDEFMGEEPHGDAGKGRGRRCLALRGAPGQIAGRLKLK